MYGEIGVDMKGARLPCDSGIINTTQRYGPVGLSKSFSFKVSISKPSMFLALNSRPCLEKCHFGEHRTTKHQGNQAKVENRKPDYGTHY